MDSEVYLLVAYDIASDKRRTHLAKFLKARLVRRQESLFEGWWPERLLQPFIESVRERIEDEEDTVRLFQLHSKTLQSAVVLGRPLPLLERDRAVIL